jgi:hypothetical protein
MAKKTAKKAAAKKTTAKKAAVKTSTSTALRSAGLPQKDLVDIGARYNLSSLTQHATTVLSKVEAQNADASASVHFADYGFGAAWTQAVEALVADIDTSADAQSEIASNALPTAAALATAFSAAKELRRQGITAIAADPTRTSPMGSLGTGASVPSTRRELAKVASAIPATAVTPSGAGKEFRVKAQAAVKALDAAEKAHKAALAKLSPAATRVHAQKGILQQELKSAARVARTVTPSDASLYAVEAHTHVKERSKKHTSKSNGAGATTAAATTATTPPNPAKG